MGVRPKRVTLISVACPTVHAAIHVETTTSRKSSSTQSPIPSTLGAQSHLSTKNRIQILLRLRTSRIRVLPQRKFEEGT